MMKNIALLLCAASLQALSLDSQAVVVIDVLEVGPDVVASGTGRLDVAGVARAGNGVPTGSYLQANIGTLALNGTISSTDYYAVTGPSNFGPGATQVTATSGTGDKFGVANGYLLLPLFYDMNPTLLTATATFAGQTFASLGVTPGSYVYTFGSGAHADSLTVNIGPIAAAVPEPGTAALAMAGLATVAGAALRRRRRDTEGDDGAGRR